MITKKTLMVRKRSLVIIIIKNFTSDWNDGTAVAALMLLKTIQFT